MFVTAIVLSRKAGNISKQNFDKYVAENVLFIPDEIFKKYDMPNLSNINEQQTKRNITLHLPKHYFKNN